MDCMETAVLLLKRGIMRRTFSDQTKEGFPDTVWALSDCGGHVFEARLTNRSTGEYHGYPTQHSMHLNADIRQRWNESDA